MPRGADYDNGIPQSDNAIDAGETKVHGTNPEYDHLNRVDRVADLPETMGSNNLHAGNLHSGQGSRGTPYSGSGKGGHDPKTLGDHKGLGAHKADGPDF